MLNSISSDYSSLAGLGAVDMGPSPLERNFNGLNIGSGAIRLPGNKSVGEKERLKELCKDFESIFVHQMMKAMRKTIDKEDSLIDGGMGEEIFQDMLDSEYSKEASKTKSLGLSDMLYRQLSKSFGDR